MSLKKSLVTQNTKIQTILSSSSLLLNHSNKVNNLTIKNISSNLMEEGDRSKIRKNIYGDNFYFFLLEKARVHRGGQLFPLKSKGRN